MTKYLTEHFASCLIILIVTCLGNMKARAAIDAALVGYQITNLSTGKVVASHNADIHFVPASTLKCVTAAAALSRLGADAQFETNVLYTGEMTDTVLSGSIIITGSGDPSLNIDFAQFLALTLPKNIQGSIEVQASQPQVNKTVMIEDVGTEYGVGWSTFNYENNRSLVNDSMQLKSEYHILQDFDIDLQGFGIKAYNNPVTPSDTTLLTTFGSQPLSELCQHMMWESDNLYAEAIGRRLSSRLLLKEALDTIVNFNKSIGITTNDCSMTDMCGLSRTNYITPRAMSLLLKAMAGNSDFTGSFPKVGLQGTLKNFMKTGRLKGSMILKSGSMSGILCYAGYKINKMGKPTHTIVVFINNATCRHKEMKSYIEQLLLKYFY